MPVGNSEHQRLDNLSTHLCTLRKCLVIRLNMRRRYATRLRKGSGKIRSAS